MHEQGKGRVDLKGRPWSDTPTNQVTPKTASQPECQRQTSSQPPKEAPTDTLNPMSTLQNQRTINLWRLKHPTVVHFAGTLEN